MHALRGDRYKYIHYHGIWDTDELYDLEADPLGAKNLITSEQHQPIIKDINRQLFDLLTNTQGMFIPLYRDAGRQQNLRLRGRSVQGEFPAHLMRKVSPQEEETPGERALSGGATRTKATTEIRTEP